MLIGVRCSVLWMSVLLCCAVAPAWAQIVDSGKTYEDNTGELQVEVNIDKAQVYVDGKLVGEVSRGQLGRFLVGSGNRQVMVTKKGYNRSVQEVIVPEYYVRKITVELVRQEPGLTVRCNQPDCIVFIDGLERGKTPLVFDIFDMGSHAIRVEKEGFAPFERVIDLTTAEQYTVDAELSSAYGQLELVTTPPGASVFLDGRRLGQTPLTMANAPTGGHSVRLVMAGYGDHFEKVKILPARTTRVEYSLRTQAGALVLKTADKDALIFLNGTPLGSGVVKIEAIEPGVYDLRVTLEGHRDAYQQMSIVEGKNNRVTVGKLESIVSRQGGQMLRKDRSQIEVNPKVVGGVLLGLGLSAGLATGGYFLFRPHDNPGDTGPKVEAPADVPQVVSLPMLGRQGLTFTLP